MSFMKWGVSKFIYIITEIPYGPNAGAKFHRLVADILEFNRRRDVGSLVVDDTISEVVYVIVVVTVQLGMCQDTGVLEEDSILE